MRPIEAAMLTGPARLLSDKRSDAESRKDTFEALRVSLRDRCGGTKLQSALG